MIIKKKKGTIKKKKTGFNRQVKRKRRLVSGDLKDFLFEIKRIKLRPLWFTGV